MEQAAKKDLQEQYKNRMVVGGVYCVKCSGTGDAWLRATADMKGAKNRFAFSVATGTCTDARMAEAWKKCGAASFSFEVLEEMKKGEAQTNDEFADDVNTLLELWTDKLGKTGKGEIK